MGGRPQRNDDHNSFLEMREALQAEFNIKLLQHEARIKQLEEENRQTRIEKQNMNMVMNLLLRKHEDFERAIANLRKELSTEETSNHQHRFSKLQPQDKDKQLNDTVLLLEEAGRAHFLNLTNESHLDNNVNQNILKVALNDNSKQSSPTNGTGPTIRTDQINDMTLTSREQPKNYLPHYETHADQNRGSRIKTEPLNEDGSPNENRGSPIAGLGTQEGSDELKFSNSSKKSSGNDYDQRVTESMKSAKQ